MSATVCWRPISGKRPTLDVNAPSKFGEIMAKRFGAEPWRVGEEGDLSWIEGVISAGGGPDFEALRAKVEKHGVIEVWREY